MADFISEDDIEKATLVQSAHREALEGILTGEKQFQDAEEKWFVLYTMWFGRHSPLLESSCTAE